MPQLSDCLQHVFLWLTRLKEVHVIFHLTHIFLPCLFFSSNKIFFSLLPILLFISTCCLTPTSFPFYVVFFLCCVLVISSSCMLARSGPRCSVVKKNVCVCVCCILEAGGEENWWVRGEENTELYQPSHTLSSSIVKNTEKAVNRLFLIVLSVRLFTQLLPW